MILRSPAVAGKFYAADPAALREQVAHSFLQAPGPGRLPAVNPDGARRIVGLVSPHAGLMYSGYAAAHAFAHLAEDGPVEVAVIFCPNHHGMGADNAVWARGAWETPLGSVRIAEECAAALLDACPLVRDDSLAHLHEHSIEVQLPFLQVLYGTGITLVPIAMKHYSLADSIALGEAVAGALEGRRGVVIASTDFSHYEPAEQARAKDAFVLEAIAQLDAEDVFRRVWDRAVTMCGHGPVAAMLAAALRMGGRHGRVLAYTHSGEITGDHRQVVGYAAAAIER